MINVLRCLATIFTYLLCSNICNATPTVEQDDIDHLIKLNPKNSAAFFQFAIAQEKQLRIAQSKAVVPANASKFNYSLNIGIAKVNSPGNSILTIENANLETGQRIVIVFPEMPQKTAEAIVVHKTKPAQSTEHGQSAYMIELLHPKTDSHAVALGILSSKDQFHINNGRITANLDGGGFKETFRIAYSQEGAHLTVWKGQPLIGKRKWHGYFYLGYDVKPNGTAKDY